MIPRARHLLFLLALIGLLAGCRSAETLVEDVSEAVTGRPAWVEEAVIYELFVPDFTEEGTFRAVIPRLPELKDLGVNTIWLMPIHPIGVKNRKSDLGALGSPYAVRDFFDVNPEYGTKDDFRALVDAVHRQGMHLIIDLVANHTAWDNAWIEAHPDWYTQNAQGEIIVPEGTDWTDVADLNYDHPALREIMREAMQFWVREFDIDGYRCDVAEAVPLDFWVEAIPTVRAIKPVLMLAEGADPALHRAGFDLTYAWPFYGQLKRVWEGASVSTLADLVQEVETALPAGGLRLRFITNHDETAWDAPPPALFGGQEGAQAAFVLTALLRGVPLVYNGQEVGVAEPVPFFEQTPYDWSQGAGVRAFYRRILALHNEHEALREGTMELLAPDAEDVMLYGRTAGSERFVVAVNVRDYSGAVELPAAFAGTVFTEVLTNEAITGPFLELPPFGYLILKAR